MKHPFQTQFVYAKHQGSKRTSIERKPIDSNGTAGLTAGDNSWEFKLSSSGDTASQTVTAKLTQGNDTEVAVGLSLIDEQWTTDNFVLIPGAVYGGNRFHAEPYTYSPPVVGPDPKEVDRTPWIGDLPRLSNVPGKSHLDQQSMDGATPALGIYFPERKKALCILTGQLNSIGTFGYEVIENEDRSSAEILLMVPGMRHDKYFNISGGYVNESPDTAADFTEGMSVDIDFDLHWIDCTSIQELFDFIFEHRYDCVPSDELKNEISFSATWDILHEKHNRENWHEDKDLYQVSINQDPPNPFMLFQTGWVGGMMTPYPMIQEGDERSLERSLRNIEHFFTSGAQTSYGLFHEYFHDGKWFSTAKMKYNETGHAEYGYDPEKQWTLVRRLGDALYFLIRIFQLLEERGHTDKVKDTWKAATRKEAEAIIDVWKRHAEFGQYIDVTTGEVKVAGSTAAALVPAALALASEYFAEPEWLKIAEDIAEKFRVEDLASGVTTGGPGDCVQSPDSESIAALIDSFVLLYEMTGTQKWLKAAEDAVVQTASWAISYDYEFPEGSALEQIGAQSRGAFIANAQNKTGVPGICTLSGQSILRVYRATGNRAYLDLLKEIAHTIPQYMGRDDKKIPTRLAWGRPGVTELPTGWICERVNVTQWGEALGEISAYSCWCEVAMMLTWCDIPGVYWNTSDDSLYTFDHVDAEVVENDSGKALRLTNPTKFDARIKVMTETAADQSNSLPINVAANLPVVTVPAGETVSWELPAL